MNIYEQLVTEAYQKFEIIFQYYDPSEASSSGSMLAFFLGGGSYAVKARPDFPHNYQAVIDAVHLYYRDTIRKNDVINYYKGGIDGILLFCQKNKKYIYKLCLYYA